MHKRYELPRQSIFDLSDKEWVDRIENTVKFENSIRERISRYLPEPTKEQQSRIDRDVEASVKAYSLLEDGKAVVTRGWNGTPTETWRKPADPEIKWVPPFQRHMMVEIIFDSLPKTEPEHRIPFIGGDR